jgi:hypothetical protein
MSLSQREPARKLPTLPTGGDGSGVAGAPAATCGQRG